MIRLVLVLIRNIFHVVAFALLLPFYAIGGLFGRKKHWVKIPLSGGVPMAGVGGLGRWFHDKPTFLQMRSNIKALAEDPHLEGMVLELNSFSVGPAIRAEVMEWIADARGAGKRVVAFGDMFTMQDYPVAAAANEIVMPPPGRLYTFKPRSEQIFANRALKKLGIFPQFIHIGAYKSASHRFIRENGTPSQRGMTAELVDGMTAHSLAQVAKSRDLSLSAASAIFANSPLDAGKARHLRLTDAEVYRPDLERWIEFGEVSTQRPREAVNTHLTSYVAYLDGRLKLNWKPLMRKPIVALVDLSGFIVTPDVQMPTSGAVIDSGVVIPLLERLAKNPNVQGVILHIDSPGGSALASDLIWQAVVDLKHEKPVVAWCSNVAASGGYYIAVGANEIICRPESIMGSIGVITGKFSIQETTKMLGIEVETHGDDSSSMMSMFSPLKGVGLESLKSDTRSFYQRFLQRVGHARGLSPRRLHRFARGRVYLGEAAKTRGLVDHLGGFEEANRRIHALMERDPDRTELKAYSHQRTSIRDAVKSSIMSAAIPSGIVSDQAALIALTKQCGTLALMPIKLDA